MKLLVSGCSFTHGAELHNGFMSPENVKQSFSAELAKHLNLQLINVALSGGSNEYIFHSIVEYLEKNSDVAKVLVVWTYHSRLHWKCDNRHYFVLPSWASSMVDLENFTMHDKKVNDLWVTGDNPDIIETMISAHEFFVRNYFDDSELSMKQSHYELCLKHLCQQKNIQYSSISVSDIFRALKILPHHLTVDEHKQAAQYIYDKFYS